jgi:ParB family chromosome partitioning protein
MAGISRQQVSRLMAFSLLPSQAVQALEGNPRVLGANAAAELASFARAGRAAQVTQAVERLVAGEIDQITALKIAAKPMAGSEKSSKEKADTRIVKQGRATYCSVRRADKSIRIDFKNLASAENAEQLIVELLEDLAKRGEKEE